MNIERALAISDYQCEERTNELMWLAQQASTRKLIAEVGSYKGCTARAMADNTAGTIYCIDTFEGSKNEIQMHQELSQHPPGWLFETFLANTSDLDNLEYLKMDSLQAARYAKEARFDMIFLDASHDYDSVKADILAWHPLLAPGGLFCGHDRQWEGVARAVSELIPRTGVGAGAIWYEN